MEYCFFNNMRSILYIFHRLFPYHTQRHQLFLHPYFPVVNGVDVPFWNLGYGYKM